MSIPLCHVSRSNFPGVHMMIEILGFEDIKDMLVLKEDGRIAVCEEDYHVLILITTWPRLALLSEHAVKVGHLEKKENKDIIGFLEQVNKAAMAKTKAKAFNLPARKDCTANTIMEICCFAAPGVRELCKLILAEQKKVVVFVSLPLQQVFLELVLLQGMSVQARALLGGEDESERKEVDFY